ncbi:MAG: addiction module protein [Proteobacteria bacterium]|jgi:hypothetical protein|nr:addiction module protein [Pseudomonadota bacterium]
MIDFETIRRMTRQEKLQAIETIWEELAKDDSQIESPPWHEDSLRETEARYAAGEDTASDWDAAKRELRKRFE